MPTAPKLFRSTATKAYQQYRNQQRGSSHERGYTWTWQKLRRWFLLQHPLCAECGRNNITTTAEEVDHIIPKCNGGTDEVSNLQPLCRPCHWAKSVKERTLREIA